MVKKTMRPPKYQLIAVDIAERIVENRYRVGDKLYARSTLASTYGVSPETARKAISVLVDLDIVEVKHGSGAFISSKEKAQEFIELYQDVSTIQDIKTDILNSVTKQQEELVNLTNLLDRLVDQTKHANRLNLFTPFELTLTKEAEHLKQTVKDINFWQQTGATIIAIQQQKDLILSPGPYAVLEEGDTVFFVGNELSYQRVQNLFYPKINENKEK